MARKAKAQPFGSFQLLLALFLLVAIPMTLYALVTSTQPVGEAKPGGKPGHGAPSGPHYNLNLIGVPKEKSADMTGSKGHRIFVRLWGNVKIRLYEADTFEVLDGNATDGTGAFQLPNPDPDNDGVTEYSVWARPLGKPGGKSTTTTCAYDEEGIEWCSVYSMVLVREKGKSSFSDVSKQLLYVYVDLDADGRLERYPLFDPALMDYFWGYDSQGMKLVQLRFYEHVPSVVD